MEYLTDLELRWIEKDLINGYEAKISPDELLGLVAEVQRCRSGACLENWD